MKLKNTAPFPVERFGETFAPGEVIEVELTKAQKAEGLGRLVATDDDADRASAALTEKREKEAARATAAKSDKD